MMSKEKCNSYSRLIFTPLVFAHMSSVSVNYKVKLILLWRILLLLTCGCLCDRSCRAREQQENELNRSVKIIVDSFMN